MHRSNILQDGPFSSSCSVFTFLSSTYMVKSLPTGLTWAQFTIKLKSCLPPGWWQAPRRQKRQHQLSYHSSLHFTSSPLSTQMLSQLIHLTRPSKPFFQFSRFSGYLHRHDTRTTNCVFSNAGVVIATAKANPYPAGFLSPRYRCQHRIRNWHWPHVLRIRKRLLNCSTPEAKHSTQSLGVSFLAACRSASACRPIDRSS